MAKNDYDPKRVHKMIKDDSVKYFEEFDIEYFPYKAIVFSGADSNAFSIHKQEIPDLISWLVEYYIGD